MSSGLRIASGTHTKTPDEINNFSLSYAPHLGDAETLLSVDAQEVVVDGATGLPTLVIDSISIDTESIDIAVSAGVDCGVYFVKVRVLTNLGQKIDGAVRVVVQNAVEAP